MKVRTPLELTQMEMHSISQQSCFIWRGTRLRTHWPVLLQIAFTCITHRDGFWDNVLFSWGELLEQISFPSSLSVVWKLPISQKPFYTFKILTFLGQDSILPM